MGRSKDDLKWQRKSEEFRKAAGVEQDFLKLLPALPYENRLSSDSVWYKLWYKQKKKKKNPLEKLETGSFPPIDSIPK